MMKCQEAERLIYLYRKGELNETEQDNLKEHLQACMHCNTLNNSLVDIEKFTTQLRNSTETNEDEITTNQIVSHVFENQFIDSEKIGSYSVSLWRKVMTIAAVLLIGIFIFQQYEIKRNVNDLNKRISQQNYSKSTDMNQVNSIQEISLTEFSFSIDGLNQEEVRDLLQLLKTEHPKLYRKMKKDVKMKKYNL